LPLRIRGAVRRSGELLACQPNKSLGSRRPWLTDQRPDPGHRRFDRRGPNVHRVPIGVQQRRGLHPAVDLLSADAVSQVAVHPRRPAPSWAVRGARAPRLGHSITRCHAALLPQHSGNQSCFRKHRGRVTNTVTHPRLDEVLLAAVVRQPRLPWVRRPR
jgi:hypothetical protein